MYSLIIHDRLPNDIHAKPPKPTKKKQKSHLIKQKLTYLSIARTFLMLVKLLRLSKPLGQLEVSYGPQQKTSAVAAPDQSNL